MSDIAPIGRAAATGFTPAARSPQQSLSSPASARGSDSVELSQMAQWLHKLHSLPAVRQDVIDRVTAQLSDGTYMNEERLEKAIEALAEELG